MLHPCHLSRGRSPRRRGRGKLCPTSSLALPHNAVGSWVHEMMSRWLRLV